MIFQEQNNNFNIEQYGFRRRKGTDIAIAKIYETIAINQHEKAQCNIVARDVQKAFDKVWLEGLQFKITLLELPEILEKIIISFTQNRSARIKHGELISNKIDLKSGVPQGSVLSPSLYITYTADMPPPGPGGLNVCFADDVTQVIEYMHASKQMLAIRTTREINKINNYENLWKIQTSADKFKLLSISASKPEDIIINNRQINFSENVNILGFKLSRTGFNPHIIERLNKARNELQKLKRFQNLRPKIKAHLYKTLVRSVIEYPIIPLCGIAKCNMRKIQILQNKAIKLITSNDPEEMDLKRSHEKYKIDAYNVRLHNRGQKLWHKFCIDQPELTDQSRELNNDNRPDHYWWRRISSNIEEDTPDPIYVYR